MSNACEKCDCGSCLVEVSLAIAAAPPATIEPGELLRRRRAAGLSQRELARRAGLRYETIGLIERGRTSPRAFTRELLAEALAEAEADPIGVALELLLRPEAEAEQEATEETEPS